MTKLQDVRPAELRAEICVSGLAGQGPRAHAVPAEPSPPVGSQTGAAVPFLYNSSLSTVSSEQFP